MRRSVGIMRPIGLGILLTAAALTPAHAQDGAAYREGLPQVLTPSDQAPDTVAAGPFRAAYARAGRPRMVVFWMRTLSDAVTAPVVTREETSGAGVVGMAASRSGAALVGGYAETRETITGAHLDTASDPLPKAQSAEVEGAFIDTLMQAGVHMVDRAAIIRLSAGTDAAQKTAETAALKRRADVLVEVTAAGSGGFENLTYRVSAIRTADGASLATMVIPADDLDLALSWEARNGGGFEGTIEPAALGQALAERLQTRLAAAW